jgi:hypothetical protein
MGVHGCHERLVVSLCCADSYQGRTTEKSWCVCDVWIILFARDIHPMGCDVVRTFFDRNYWARSYAPAQTINQAFSGWHGYHFGTVIDNFTFLATTEIV